MRAFACVVALCCFTLSVEGKNEDYQYAREHIDSLELTQQNMDDTFVGLDFYGEMADGKINSDDLGLLYWYKKSKFAIRKFVRWLDDKNTGEKGDDVVDKKELENFLRKKASVLATIECSFVKSKSLREQCFADQLLNYIYLVLDEDDVNQFYNHIELDNDDDDVIKFNDVQKLKENFDGLDDDAFDNFMEELGGHNDGVIDKEEFNTYVTQEDISDNFRECRIGKPDRKGNAKYDDNCLTRELIEYTLEDLTEMDISITFRKIDNNGNKVIDAADLKNILNIDETRAEKAINMMDSNGDKTVLYSEFRTYIKTSTIRLQLERECTEKFHKQAEEIECVVQKFSTLLKELHEPIWLVVPDLDMLFTFEEIDDNDNGLIQDDDLAKWNDADLANKFKKEVDSPNDKDTHVDLEEFNQYVDIPHMVYGIADSMLHPKSYSRVYFYVDGLKRIIRNFLEEGKIDELWKYYNKNNDAYITKNEITGDGKFETDDEVDDFLRELGMGDDTVSKFEFTWYVKQLELADLYKEEDKSPANLHTILKSYVNDYMTEHDIEEAFQALDTNHNHELDLEDWDGDNWNHVIENINFFAYDRDNTGNFVEFWLWLQKDVREKKKILEDKCTKLKKIHTVEVDCYKNTIVSGDLLPRTITTITEGPLGSVID